MVLSDVDKLFDQLLSYAKDARTAGNFQVATAAYRAALSIGGSDSRAAEGLYGLAVREGFWSGLRSASEEVTDTVYASPGHTIFRANYLSYKGDLSKAEQLLRHGLGVFPKDTTVPDFHSNAAARIGLLESTLASVEIAVARGLRDRDHVIERGAGAGILLGELSRARILVSHALAHDARTRLGRRLDEAEQALEQANRAASWDVSTIASQLRNAQDPGTRMFTAAWILLHLRSQSATESSVLGISRLLGIIGAGRSFDTWIARRSWLLFPEAPGTQWAYALQLLLVGDVAEAGKLLIGCVGRFELNDNLARMLAFAAARRAITRVELEQAIERIRPNLSDPAIADFVLGDRSAPPGDLLAHRQSVEGRETHIARTIAPFYRKGAHTKARLAVCVSGQMRGFRRNWKMTSAALERFEPVVFVSTWTKTGSAFGAHGTVSRFLPNSITAWFATEFHRIDVFRAALPSCYARLISETSVTEDDLRETYGTPHIVIRDEEEFELLHKEKADLYHRGNLNQAKMFFGIYDANQLRRRYQEETGSCFDLVIRLRPDRPIRYLSASDMETAIERRALVVPSSLIGGVDDQFAIASSGVADLYGDIWPSMESAASGRWRAGASGRFNEFMVAEFMAHHGVELHTIDGSDVPALGGTSLLPSEFLEPLEKDVRQAGPGQDIRNAFAMAVIEALVSEGKIIDAKHLLAVLMALSGPDVVNALRTPRSRELLQPIE